MASLANNLCAAALAAPEKLALKCSGLDYSYAQFDQAAARVATRLEHAGVQPGDRVGLMLPNTLAFPIAFYGIMRRGAVAVPMNPLLKSREIEYYLSNTGAKMLYATSLFADEAAKGADSAGAGCAIVHDRSLTSLLADFEPQTKPVTCRADDTAVILHTSGTTGKPKGAQLTHGGLARNADVTARTLLQLESGDVIMGCLPLFHVFGLTCGLNTAVLAGATLTLLPRFDAHEALNMIARDGVTVFEGVPTMYSSMLSAVSAEASVDSLRLCVSGGAALPVQVLNGFEDAFKTVVLEGYGLSETSPVACFNHPDRTRKPGSIGTPIEGVEMRVVDESASSLPSGESGEVQIRGHNVMKGYWNLPDATAAAICRDGWFSSGDIGRVDDDGYFWIVDRKKELIIRGGMNVYPREIEEVLYEHPAVAAAAVIGIPDDHFGEEIGAAVELKEGATATGVELRDFVKARVAGYKYPRRVWILEALPKGPTGKLLKRDIVIPEEQKS